MLSEFDILMFFGRPWIWAGKHYSAKRKNLFWMITYNMFDFMYRPHLDHAIAKRKNAQA